MTDKRFTTNGYYIFDTYKDDQWLVNEVEADLIVDKMNNLDEKARERSKALSKLQKENEQLKQEIQSINKDLTQIMLILLDDDIVSKLTEIELKAFERLSKFKGDV